MELGGECPALTHTRRQAARKEKDGRDVESRTSCQVGFLGESEVTRKEIALGGARF